MSVILPKGTSPSPSQTIKVRERDFGWVVHIRVRLTPESGDAITVDAQMLKEEGAVPLVTPNTTVQRVHGERLGGGEALVGVDLPQRCRRERVERGKLGGEVRHGSARTAFPPNRKEHIVFELGLDELIAPRVVEVTVVNEIRFRGAGMILRVATEVADHVIGVAIAVEISTSCSQFAWQFEFPNPVFQDPGHIPQP